MNPVAGPFYFRSRGGPTHGWGNIFRLVSFAQFCRQKGHRDIMFFVEGPEPVTDYIQQSGFRMVRLPEGLSTEKESEILSEYPRPSVFIVEMLDITWELQAMLRKHVEKLIVFDDLLDHVYCADLVVCGQELPGYGNRELSSPDTRFLTGLDYFLCRPEFIPFHKKKRTYPDTIKTILITLGGGAYDIGYLKAAKAVAKLDSQITPTFVMGYAPQKNLERSLLKILPQARILRGVDDMPTLFWETDFAIVSGGYNKLEAAITGTPAVIISVQWHQIPLSDCFSKISGMPHAGYMSYVSLSEIVKLIQAHSGKPHVQKIVDNSRNVVDGKGFERVYNEIRR